ncbi:MAG: diguanylate cyclase, partial [Cyanobacteria bacterium P01_G01_bin.49]
KTQLKTEELNRQLQEKIAVLEIRDKAGIKLSQMNEFIQACLSLNEAQEIIADLLQPLFPDTSGIVYLMNNSGNLVDAIASWGEPNSDQHFEPKECWAIRRGNCHQANADTPGLYCSHVDRDSHANPTLCLPMIAKGETIGMLHLQFLKKTIISRSSKNLAETVAQNLALSFANLKLQEELRHQSLRDPLTGLYNRRYLQETLQKEIDRAHRKQQFVSIIMLDVDHFKRFNDVYGHSAGDLVLKQVGSYLLSETRKYDIACRYGGEELIVVMPDATIEDTIIRAETIREKIKKLKLEHEGRDLDSISVSIGVSCFPDDGTDPEKLIQAADKALYLAKEEGRDCVKRC